MKRFRYIIIAVLLGVLAGALIGCQYERRTVKRERIVAVESGVTEADARYRYSIDDDD